MEDEKMLVCPECGKTGDTYGQHFVEFNEEEVSCVECDCVFNKKENTWIKAIELNILKRDMGTDGDMNSDKACHQRRHQFLHKGLDELLAQFITETCSNILEVPIMELVRWSSDVANGKGHRGHGNH